jgi:hypothetical protein
LLTITWTLFSLFSCIQPSWNKGEDVIYYNTVHHYTCAIYLAFTRTYITRDLETTNIVLDNGYSTIDQLTD